MASRDLAREAAEPEARGAPRRDARDGRRPVSRHAGDRAGSRCFSTKISPVRRNPAPLGRRGMPPARRKPRYYTEKRVNYAARAVLGPLAGML